ncbi:DUF192 domain-containing protein [Haloterrigena sp. SYSU A558-1]|uniref:DUF192 domain-containing protein n=1 Tax=Haloterrigena gelatinilytica TaxID=2741724 RepID=A0A8J8GRQ8_9EURY|nr:DUF192 domain-containing protein [Haloterrigena gelatinilytica]NUC71338.1 DUF192 domain-containing protein [Haloterrigena gelatinilytica]
MQLVHEAGSSGDATDEGGDRRVLAADVDLADSLLSQTRGLMFRRSMPDDSALAFRFDSAKVRDVHMLFVFFPIDAVWVVDGVVERIERLRPWRSFARAECDLLVELPAGAADGVEDGDRVVLES